ncbi:hypothetical protein UCRPA7_4199 [Phaeoacremonium minimum UCRPA7]|uniref:Uncharacterized protein n=1 Tax=Phaeoacremonium minimum (strain UCR-PA7) TaxID=1286976 RepID=R8BLP2_PHAM7|nr:hypothetical protein UCRPA7_4199 [Phaeoacremonium minimum UCRPA7]EOO00278.1 hypothetical protein UCRPA7_4199 [Phaeoacremonium minimum UCRPA7]
MVTGHFNQLEQESEAYSNETTESQASHQYLEDDASEVFGDYTIGNNDDMEYVKAKLYQPSHTNDVLAFLTAMSHLTVGQEPGTMEFLYENHLNALAVATNSIAPPVDDTKPRPTVYSTEHEAHSSDDEPETERWRAELIIYPDNHPMLSPRKLMFALNFPNLAKKEWAELGGADPDTIELPKTFKEIDNKQRRDLFDRAERNAEGDGVWDRVIEAIEKRSLHALFPSIPLSAKERIIEEQRIAKEREAWQAAMKVKYQREGWQFQEPPTQDQSAHMQLTQEQSAQDQPQAQEGSQGKHAAKNKRKRDKKKGKKNAALAAPDQEHHEAGMSEEPMATGQGAKAQTETAMDNFLENTESEDPGHESRSMDNAYLNDNDMDEDRSKDAAESSTNLEQTSDLMAISQDVGGPSGITQDSPVDERLEDIELDEISRPIKSPNISNSGFAEWTPISQQQQFVHDNTTEYDVDQEGLEITDDSSSQTLVEEEPILAEDTSVEDSDHNEELQYAEDNILLAEEDDEPEVLYSSEEVSDISAMAHGNGDVQNQDEVQPLTTVQSYRLPLVAPALPDYERLLEVIAINSGLLITPARGTDTLGDDLSSASEVTGEHDETINDIDASLSDPDTLPQAQNLETDFVIGSEDDRISIVEESDAPPADQSSSPPHTQLEEADSVTSSAQDLISIVDDDMTALIDFAPSAASPATVPSPRVLHANTGPRIDPLISRLIDESDEVSGGYSVEDQYNRSHRGRGRSESSSEWRCTRWACTECS